MSYFVFPVAASFSDTLASLQSAGSNPPFITEHQFSILLYLFSSFIQADAAIFAIIGVFVVYRLQSLENDFDNGLRFLKEQARMNGLPERADKLELAETIQEREEALKAMDEPPFKAIVGRLRVIPNAIAQIRRSIKWPLGLFIFHILMNCILLGVADTIPGQLVLYVAALTIGVFASILISVFKLVRGTLMLSAQEIVKKKLV
jgi:hypothetical protein